MSEQDIEVGIDERIRLTTAVLAASAWPAMEQAQTPHAVHPHSKQTMHYLQPYKEHDAVTLLNAALADGVGLDAVFETAARAPFAGEIQRPLPAPFADGLWLAALNDFAQAAAIAPFWQEHAAAWDEALDGLNAIFNGKQVAAFIAEAMGKPIANPILLMPTVTYPLLEPVVVENNDQIFVILPPAKAWGESRPWPHGDDPGWAIAQVCYFLSHYLLRDQLAAMDAVDGVVLLHAIVVLCLERELNDAEAMAYLVRTKKEQKLPQLMLAVENLRDYLENSEGKTLASVVD